MVFLWTQAHKFINAYAAFLKRQGKLPIPGKYSASSTSPSHTPPSSCDPPSYLAQDAVKLT